MVESGWMGGITSWTGYFNDTDYEAASTFLRELGFKLLTFLLLYSSLFVDHYIAAAEFDAERRFAELGGGILFFIVFSVVDIFVRTKYPSHRLFDELAIVSIYTSIFVIFTTMFAYASYAVAVALVSCAVVLYKLPTKTVSKPSAAVEAIIKALPNDDDTLRSLMTATLILAVQSPDSESTIALLEELRRRCRATAP